MSNVIYPDRFLIVLCLSLIGTSAFLMLQPEYVGFALMFWSLLGLGKFMKIIEASGKGDRPSKSGKPVKNLLKGLDRQKDARGRRAVKMGLKTSLLLFLGFGLLASALLFWGQGVQALQTISYITLAGLMFWNVQAEATSAVKASLIGTVLASALCIQIALFHSLQIDYQAILRPSMENGLLLIGGGFLAAVYWRGLMVRHRHHFFPAIGLFLMMFLSLTFYELSIVTLPVLSGLLAICFSQSFPTARPKFYSYLRHHELYT